MSLPKILTYSQQEGIFPCTHCLRIKLETKFPLLPTTENIFDSIQNISRTFHFLSHNLRSECYEQIFNDLRRNQHSFPGPLRLPTSYVFVSECQNTSHVSISIPYILVKSGHLSNIAITHAESTPTTLNVLCSIHRKAIR